MLMTITQAAGSLGVSRGWVAQLVGRGTIPAIRYGPIWLIEDEDVEAYRAERRGPGWTKDRPRKSRQDGERAALLVRDANRTLLKGAKERLEAFDQRLERMVEEPD